MIKRKKTNQGLAVWLTVLGFVMLTAVIVLLLQGKDIMLFNPKGYIAQQQMRLLILSTLIMLEIAIPVLFALYYFAWRYRETNEKATRDPKAGQGKGLSYAIWGFPLITAALLAIILIPATYKLQPHKKLETGGETMRIQVVALRWKWLFIYPEQQMASLNYVRLPVGTPVQFELTADEAPMSSFWIPHLGGMLYAMTGHENHLNLVADEIGEYEGSAAEINGAGMAGMRFETVVSTREDFDSWVQSVALSQTQLDTNEYAKLLEPTEEDKPIFYANADPELYSTILGKYADSHQHSSTTEHTEHAY